MTMAAEGRSIYREYFTLNFLRSHSWKIALCGGQFG